MKMNFSGRMAPEAVVEMAEARGMPLAEAQHLADRTAARLDAIGTILTKVLDEIPGDEIDAILPEAGLLVDGLTALTDALHAHLKQLIVDDFLAKMAAKGARFVTVDQLIEDLLPVEDSMAGIVISSGFTAPTTDTEQ